MAPLRPILSLRCKVERDQCRRFGMLLCGVNSGETETTTFPFKKGEETRERNMRRIKEAEIASIEEIMQIEK